jgi:hypothetical protein
MMSTVHFTAMVTLALSISVLGSTHARAEALAPYKDDLFAYQNILERADDGAFLKVDYQEKRDIDKRDEEPERRVRARYVSLSVRRHQVMETLALGDRQLDVFRVGDIEKAAFAVIFIHGRGGDRRLGANDFSFGGNFNRLKNLAVANRGVYLAPSVRSFDQDGLADLAGLVAMLANRSPETRIILSCASMGSILCWSAAREPKIVDHLAGMMVMGGVSDPGYGSTPAYDRRLPLFLSHGSRDSVYAAGDQMDFYKNLAAAKYPVRFVLFETGSHGTPVRMTDWRDSLNWLLSR